MRPKCLAAAPMQTPRGRARPNRPARMLSACLLLAPSIFGAALATSAMAQEGRAAAPTEGPVRLAQSDLDRVHAAGIGDGFVIQIWSIDVSFDGGILSGLIGTSNGGESISRTIDLSDVRTPVPAVTIDDVAAPITDTATLTGRVADTGVVVSAEAHASSCCNGPSSSTATVSVSVSSPVIVSAPAEPPIAAPTSTVAPYAGILVFELPWGIFGGP